MPYATVTIQHNTKSTSTNSRCQIKYANNSYYDFDVNDLNDALSSHGLFLDMDNIIHYKNKLLKDGCFSKSGFHPSTNNKFQFIVSLDLTK